MSDKSFGHASHIWRLGIGGPICDRCYVYSDENAAQLPCPESASLAPPSLDAGKDSNFKDCGSDPGYPCAHNVLGIGWCERHKREGASSPVSPEADQIAAQEIRADAATKPLACICGELPACPACGDSVQQDHAAVVEWLEQRVKFYEAEVETALERAASVHSYSSEHTRWCMAADSHRFTLRVLQAELSSLRASLSIKETHP